MESLVDTGATTSCVMRDVFESISEDIRLLLQDVVVACEVTGFDGSMSAVLGIVTLELCVSARKFKEPFLVIEGEGFATLGWDFVCKYSIQFDYANGMLVLQSCCGRTI